MEILAHLYQHPGAQDTAEGIVEWWLLERSVRRETRRVKDAIDDLVLDGFIERVTGYGNHAQYRINHRRMKEIQDLVAEYE